ncbi:maestro heat-like repeat-containing protein family member 7 isoform X2 [Neopsephotus bourkii]|uniref:maestro heat-like repeat-containing protein family member 7 isoform X2 n=1 Tax=Neopsephotus bourkii TaxID=309878 RepID=UPI002AA54354|nr:maestro heat-like repeat-containing protein family member 7 isoform X2 [Neopsephotus bourkii]
MEEERTAHMQFIQTFLQSSVKEEAQKVQFLQAVSSLCTAARDQGFLEELREFCEQHQVAENIKALVEEEPMDHVHTVVRQQAMLTLAQMSKVQMLLKRKKKSLLTSCFRKVFLLPPITSRKGEDSILYFQTLDAMDVLLESFVLSSPGSRDLRRILQMLLPFTDIEHAAVCERAVARIAKLADLMASSSSVQVRRQAPSSQAVSHSLPTVGSSLQLEMPEAFSMALPWARVLASLFPMVFPPSQCPFCQEPSWLPVLCRTALPKEHGGRPGLAALPALLPSSLLWEGPAQL